MTRKNVLITPLNWGLGHASRCVPLIKKLIARDCAVYVASDGEALTLLKKEFPSLKFFELPSYNIKYSSALPLWFKLLFQIHRIISAIRKEQKEVKKLVDRLKIHLIISDNRYGCRSGKIPGIFITHQLNIQLPKYLIFFSDVVRYFNERAIKKFDDCWVPDLPGSVLTGALTHPTKLKTKFIGILSRFEKAVNYEMKYKVAVILSGPEPQRTVLESLLLRNLKNSEFTAAIVRGTNDSQSDTSTNIQMFNLLSADEIQRLISQSELIIARPGYSTIMDLAKLQKKAVLIPTPGQTEQEYLAHRHMHEGRFYSVSQDDFELKDALIKSVSYAGFENLDLQEDLLDEALEELI